jgi:O-Antigen ligase
MTRWSAHALFALLAVSTLLAWLPYRWPVSLLEIGSSGLAIAWLIAISTGAKRMVRAPVLAAVAMVPAWGAIQWLTGETVQAAVTFSAVLNWTCYTALFFVAIQVAADAGARAALLRNLMIFGAVLCVEATLQAFTSDGRVFWLFPVREAPFTMGPFLYHTHFANFVELLLPLLLVEALAGRRRFAHALMAAAMFASVVASASRGGVVLISIEAVALTMLIAQRKHDWRSAARLLAVMAAISAVFTAVVGWNVLVRRFEKPDALYGRQEMLLASLDMFGQHAAMGTGLGTWTIEYPGYARYDDGLFANAAHSDWAQWACEGGVVVLAAMLIVGLWAAIRGVRSVWGIGVLFVLAHAVFDYPFQKPAIAALCFVLLGLLSSVSSESQAGRFKPGATGSIDPQFTGL